MVKENTNSMMDQFLLEHGSIIKQKEVEFSKQNAVQHTQVIGRMVYQMGRQKYSGQTVLNIQGSLLREEETDLASLSGQMEVNTQDNGKMAKKMDLEH